VLQAEELLFIELRLELLRTEADLLCPASDLLRSGADLLRSGAHLLCTGCFDGNRSAATEQCSGTGSQCLM
jgi:hypothetical protein